MSDRRTELIREVQRKLSIDITGEMDAATRKAVKSFQKSLRVTPTGDIDTEVLKMLGMTVFIEEVNEFVLPIQQMFLTTDLIDRSSYPNRITISYSPHSVTDQFVMWNFSPGIPMGSQYCLDATYGLWRLHKDSQWAYHISGFGNRIVQQKSIGVCLCGASVLSSEEGRENLKLLLKRICEDFTIPMDEGLVQMRKAGVNLDIHQPKTKSDITKGIFIEHNYHPDAKLPDWEHEQLEKFLDELIYDNEAKDIPDRG